MDASRVAVLRELLAATDWVRRTRDFARTLRTSTVDPGGLLLVGTPADEPWHLAAHLDDEARYSDLPQLAPTLVRWQPPADAPRHLAVSLDRLEAARRGETVFVVAPGAAPDGLLERVADARRVGATVLAIEAGDAELQGLAHERLTVVQPLAPSPSMDDLASSFEIVQHLVSAAAGEAPDLGRHGFRDRLGRMLDVISGPPPSRRR